MATATKKTATSNRATITLEPDMEHVLEGIRVHTGFAPSQVIAKLLLAHLPELWAYLRHLESLPEGESPERSQAINMLRSYGPLTLTQAIEEAKAHPWKA